MHCTFIIHYLCDSHSFEALLVWHFLWQHRWQTPTAAPQPHWALAAIDLCLFRDYPSKKPPLFKMNKCPKIDLCLVEIKPGQCFLSNSLSLQHKKLLWSHLMGSPWCPGFGVDDHRIFKSRALSIAYTDHIMEMGVTLRLLPPSHKQPQNGPWLSFWWVNVKQSSPKHHPYWSDMQPGFHCWPLWTLLRLRGLESEFKHVVVITDDDFNYSN